MDPPLWIPRDLARPVVPQRLVVSSVDFHLWRFPSMGLPLKNWMVYDGHSWTFHLFIWIFFGGATIFGNLYSVRFSIWSFQSRNSHMLLMNVGLQVLRKMAKLDCPPGSKHGEYSVYRLISCPMEGFPITLFDSRSAYPLVNTHSYWKQSFILDLHL